MAYRLYFASEPLHEAPTDSALKTAVVVDFESEAEALKLACEFLHLHLMYPVALERPDGSRMTEDELEEWCRQRGIELHPERSIIT